jgi:hypothetical protein
MEKLVITRNNPLGGTSDITIHFTEPINPIEAAEMLVKELKQWNGQAYSSIKSIHIL